MQANGMVSHSAPGQTEPVRSVAPLCIPVVGKVQLSSRLQQLLQKSNELDRLQALQQQQQAARQTVLGGAGDQRAAAEPPPDGRRRGPLGASAAARPPLLAAARPANGQLKEVQPPLPPSPAAGTPPHVVSAVGDGFTFKTGGHERARPPAHSLPTAFAINSGSHQKILPKPVPQSVVPAEAAVSYKVDKVKTKHKGGKAAARVRADSTTGKVKSRAAVKVRPADSRPVARLAQPESRGARPRARPVSAPVVPQRPSLPAELRAYQTAWLQERTAHRPLLPPPAGCSDLEATDTETEAELEAGGVPAAARRYREWRRFPRCCRLLVAELRRRGGPAAARLCGSLLRPPAGAADTERGRRLCARQRLEARRLLASLEEARDRRRQLGERARLALLLVDAAAAFPGRTAQLLLSDRGAGQTQPGHNSSRSAQLVRRPCCHKGTNGACQQTALPCTRHCASHILYNVDQLLFQHCTAKFSDNTQCCAPVFDIKHELPLCEEHARKRDNYEKMAEKTRSEPKKKSRSIKRPKRRKKAKKKTTPRESTPTELNRQGSFEDGSFGEMEADLLDEDDDEEEEEDEDDLDDEDEDGAEGGGGGGQPAELDRSLELNLGTVLENEFSEVLSKLPDEAFTELFSDTHAGDLVHKETEELERALEAVERESDGQGGSGAAAPKPELQAAAGAAAAAAAAAVAAAAAGGAGEPAAAAAPRHHVLNGNPSLGGSAEMEESVYSQLAQGISLENAISNVLNGQEMNTLNQLLNHLGETVIQDGDNATISAS